MHGDLEQIEGFDISFHEKSKRIIDIKIEDQIIDRLILVMVNEAARCIDEKIARINKIAKLKLQLIIFRCF